MTTESKSKGNSSLVGSFLSTFSFEMQSSRQLAHGKKGKSSVIAETCNVNNFLAKK